MRKLASLLAALPLAPLAAFCAGAESETIRCELAVIAGGSGGFGAALAAARRLFCGCDWRRARVRGRGLHDDDRAGSTRARTRNLLITCRAASFSSIAASSCRLSRTMMQLGQAAGTAVALAKELKVELPDVPAERLRAALRQQHVQLEHPMPGELRAYLQKEQP